VPTQPDVPALSAVRKVSRRLIPFLFLLYILNFLDRVNVGFAALQMNQALHLSPTAYSLGAGMFFLTYTLFEVPSNVMLARVGARRWIARIMISWGIVSAAMMFVRGPVAFYVLRCLLGVAEAGFFPGIIFCLTRWFPSAERGRAVASFMTAVVVAGIIGGPVSGALLSLNGVGRLAGWQWLFLLEGLPAVLLGVIVLRALPDRPVDAAWLTVTERTTLEGHVEREEARHASGVRTFGAALKSGRVWLLAVVYFTIPVALYAVGFWLPQIVKRASGSSDFLVGALSAIPYAVAAVGMVLVGRHSDRTGERRWHVAIPAVVAGASFAATAFVNGTAMSLLTLSIAMLGLAAMFGPFWTLATSFVSGIGAATGIALVNSVGNIGGFAGPNIIGLVSERTGSLTAGLVAVGVVLACGGLLVLAIDDPKIGAVR